MFEMQFKIDSVQERPRCKEQGCDKAGYPCFLIMGHRPHEYLCQVHSVEQGYCCCCGDFAAGTNGFDFVHPGLCDNCNYEINSEVEDLDNENPDEFD